jgi:mannosyltransferase
MSSAGQGPPLFERTASIDRRVLIGLTLLALLLRAADLGAQSLWFDETYTALIASLPLGRAFEALIADGVHPPLFYLLEGIMLRLGRGEALLRLPSVMAGSVSVPLIYILAKRWLGSRVALLTAGLLAVSPFGVWYARDARMYALLGMLSILSMVFYDRLLERPSRRDLAGFVATNACAYLTHYFALFLPIIQLVHQAIHLRRHWRLLRAWTMAEAVAAAPALLWVAAIAQRDAQIFGIGWIPRPGVEDIPRTLMNFTTGAPAQVRPLHWVMLAVALVVMSLGIRTRWAEPDRKSLALVWCLLPMVVSFLASLQRPVYIDRFFIISLGAWLLLLGSGAGALQGRWFGVASAALAGILIFGLIEVNWIDHQTKEQWREAAEYLERAGENEIIVPRVVQMVVPLRYYYRGKANIEALEVNRERRSLAALTAGFDGAWIIYWNASAEAHCFACSPSFDRSAETAPDAQAWISGLGPELIERADFKGVTVMHFKLASG